MASFEQTPEQTQYPTLDPYASSNGRSNNPFSGSGDNTLGGGSNAFNGSNNNSFGANNSNPLNGSSNNTFGDSNNTFGESTSRNSLGGSNSNNLTGSSDPVDETAGRAQGMMQNAKNNAQATMDSVKNSQMVQSFNNGPIADQARQHAAATSTEFSNLAGARQTPSTKAATGQELTYYHSFFYSLLSWENPRATALSYVAIALFIIAFRYVPLVSLGLRLSWIVLGITAAAEIAGKMVFDQGLTSKLRPKKYYTIPRDTLENTMDDVEHLINFFVIETQRIVFAENIYKTVAAFATALITYLLIKITPAWGLALIGTTVVYFVPLVYIQNKELIDHHLQNASDVIGQQTQQVKEVATHHTNKAIDASSKTLKDYSARASEMVGQTKQKAVEKNIISPQTANQAEQTVRGESFPEAPKQDPFSPSNMSAQQTNLQAQQVNLQAQQARAEPQFAQ